MPSLSPPSVLVGGATPLQLRTSVLSLAHPPFSRVYHGCCGVVGGVPRPHDSLHMFSPPLAGPGITTRIFPGGLAWNVRAGVRLLCHNVARHLAMLAPHDTSRHDSCCAFHPMTRPVVPCTTACCKRPREVWAELKACVPMAKQEGSDVLERRTMGVHW